MSEAQQVAEDATETTETTETTEQTTEQVTEQAAEQTSNVEQIADWREAIKDGNVRKHADRYQTIEDALKNNLEQRKLISKAIFKPEDPKDEKAVAAFRKALNVPEKIEDYPLALPDGVKLDDPANQKTAEQLKSFAELAHGHNVSSDAFQAMVKWAFDIGAAVQNDAATQDKAFVEQSEAELRKEWGANFGREQAFASRGAEWLFGDDFQKFREMKTADDRLIGDHPLLLKALNKIGRSVSEDSMLGPTPVDASTAQSLKAELESLTVKQMDAQNQGRWEEAKALDAKIMDVAARISGDRPIVGSMGGPTA